MITIQNILALILNIEGEYKWYVLTGIIFLLGAIFSRLIFKTLKWFFILILLVVLGAAIYLYLR